MRGRPSRRRLLTRAGGGLAVALATAGCLGAASNPFGGEDGMRVRARAATGTQTDTQCRLSADFVAAHPALEEVLTEASEGSSGGWASRQVTVKRGESLGDALHDHCEGETRGLYRYRGDWYFVSLQYEDPDDHGHPEGRGDRHGSGAETGSHGHGRVGEARAAAPSRHG